MFPGFEKFDQIFSDNKPKQPTPRYTPENPLYTYGSAVTVVNGEKLYTSHTVQQPKQSNLYSY